ncbi:MAG: hypothetical protein EXR49_04515 [Dehalococcoidia bacterium]|nr:hypothetical protein [Dehalococcoidia bacterium]
MGLLARVLEEQGLPTATITSARDITEAVKPPRAVFVNFPLGHEAGAPFDIALQRRIVGDALAILESATVSGTIIDLAYAYPPDPGWEQTFV